MQRSLTSYYKILEVDPKTSPEVIEAAYRRLARRYHPDLNPNRDSTLRMQVLNEAYAVLHDPQKRRSYDLYLAAQTKTEQGPTATGYRPRTQSHAGQTAKPSAGTDDSQGNASSWADMSLPHACQRCGRSDASLRIATFPYVVSTIRHSVRQGESGFFCSKCRHHKMYTAKAKSLAFGWWGIPLGIPYTLGVLCAPSDGILDIKLNADYLRWLAVYFINQGRLYEAQYAVQSSLDLHYDPELAAAANKIFGRAPRHQRQRAKKKKTLVALGIGALMALLIAVAMNDALKLLMSEMPVALISQQTTLANQAIQPSDSKYLAARADWSQFEIAQSAIAIEYPTDWAVDVENDQGIELTGPSTGFSLMWSTHESETFITDIIAFSQKDPTFVDNYISSLRGYLQGELDKDGGSVERIESPVVKQIGPYMTMYNDVTTTYASQSGSPVRSHVLLYFFDCGAYVCQVSFYKVGGEPFTATQIQTSERILRSIKLAAPKPDLGAPSPSRHSIAPDESGSIERLSFCTEKEFSAFTKQCGRSRAIFTGILQRLYVSWVPAKEVKGANILNKWYLNGEYLLANESANNFGFLEGTSHKALEPGHYAVELYMANKLVGHGSFILQQ